MQFRIIVVLAFIATVIASPVPVPVAPPVKKSYVPLPTIFADVCSLILREAKAAAQDCNTRAELPCM